MRDVGKGAAQRRMQRSASFGGVDEVAIEQSAYRRWEIGCLSDVEKSIERRAVVMLARETGVKRADAAREILRSCGILSNQPCDRDLSQMLGVRLQ